MAEDLTDGDKVAITLIALEIMRDEAASGRKDAKDFHVRTVDPAWDAQNDPAILVNWRSAVEKARFLILNR